VLLWFIATGETLTLLVNDASKPSCRHVMTTAIQEATAKHITNLPSKVYRVKCKGRTDLAQATHFDAEASGTDHLERLLSYRQLFVSFQHKHFDPRALCADVCVEADGLVVGVLVNGDAPSLRM